MRLDEIRKIQKAKAETASTEEKTYVPIFVPMGSQKGSDTVNCLGVKRPVHTTDVITRQIAIKTWLDEGMRTGSVGTIYKAWFYAFVCGVLAVVFLFINIYIAAIFAYLTGYYWSERLLNDAWSLQWYKGKTLTYTK